MKKAQILDCTLRDGGYYTDWDFNDNIVTTYLNGLNNLPIDYIEIGYRSKPTKEYQGKFGYTPVYVLQQIRQLSKKKIAVMLNEKSTLPEDLNQLTEPIKEFVDMVRIAVAPKNLQRAITLAKAVKEQGFEVAFNIMYMSTWDEYENFYEQLKELNGIVDIVNMVDSFGGVLPDDVTTIVNKLRQSVSCKIGFHGHNNLQMSLINTLTAINCGVDSVDCTILGMGRGAGNLNTELLLTCLSKCGLEVNFNNLGNVITAFTSLYEKFRWGTSLPYMLSGAYSIPQKDVMEWVQNRVYTLNNIVRALDNRRFKQKDNARYPAFEQRNPSEAIIIGGGESVMEHITAIIKYAIENDVSLIFATSRYAALFNDCDNRKYFVLVGNESKRFESNICDRESFSGTCILPPYPRLMGTDVPPFAQPFTYELAKIDFTDNYLDSCTTVALQTAICLGAEKVRLVGYDGYMGSVLSEKETKLTMENRAIFLDFKNFSKNDIVSLSKTLYQELTVKSIYQFL